jgi:hypothetical protein
MLEADGLFTFDTKHGSIKLIKTQESKHGKNI